MDIQVKNLKLGIIGREGIRTFTCELHIDGQHVANCLEEGNGGMLRIRSIIDNKKWKEIEQAAVEMIKKTSKYINERAEMYAELGIKDEGQHNEVLESYVISLVADEETMVDVRKRQSKGLMYLDGDALGKISWGKWTMEQMLAGEKARKALYDAIMKKHNEGCTIMNTNIGIMKQHYPDLEGIIK